MELKQAVVLRFRCGYLDFCINYSKDATKETASHAGLPWCAIIQRSHYAFDGSLKHNMQHNYSVVDKVVL